MTDSKHYLEAARILADFYALDFGGKEKGRYRISEKLLRRLLKRRRLYEADIVRTARALYELGYVLVDMESFFVVLSTSSFVNYRRVSETNVQKALDPQTE